MFASVGFIILRIITSEVGMWMSTSLASDLLTATAVKVVAHTMIVSMFG